MTTQARELAKLVTNAGDLNLVDDISLASDGAILNFGADSDVNLTHVADTGLLLNSSRQLQFGDSGTHIRQSADGVLQLTSDTEVEINATTVDINANVDVSGNIVLGGTITVGDADDDNMVINANVNSHIIPNTDDTFDLGSASQQWRNVYVDGTLEADAITVADTALAEYISDTVGAMVGSNTESGITVAYQDGDNTLDFTVATLNQDTTGTADNITATANNSTDETVYPTFVDGATGSQGIETDTGLTYNPSSGLLTATGFSGALTGNVTGNVSGTAATVTGAAQSAITSVGTLTGLALSGSATISGSAKKLTITDTADNTSGGILALAHNKSSGTQADNDDAGRIYFYADDDAGNAYEAGLIRTVATDVSNSSEDSRMYLYTYENGSQKNPLTLDGSKVGIGTASPTAVLDVVGPAARPTSLAEIDTGSTARFRSDSSNADSLYIAEGDSGAIIQVNDGATNSSTAKDLQLQPFGGHVGIGTVDPAEELHIKGAASAYTILRIESGSTSHGSTIEFADATDADYGEILQFASSAGEGGRMRFRAGGTETMNLRGGKVGIGTASPTSPLHISSATNRTLLLDYTAGSGGYTWASFKQSGTEKFRVFGDYTAGYLSFYNETQSAHQLTLASNGKVGIGESSPDKHLHIKNTATGSTGIAIENTNNGQNLDIDFYSNAGAAQGRIRYAEGSGDISLNPNVSGSDPFTVKWDGKVGIGTTSLSLIHI